MKFLMSLILNAEFERVMAFIFVTAVSVLAVGFMLFFILLFTRGMVGVLA